MISRIQRTALLFSALTLASGVRAQPSAPTLTLAHALRLAHSQPAVLQAAARVAARSHVRDAAKHRYLPTLSLGVDDTLGHQHLSEADVRGAMSDLSLSARAVLDARLFDFGQRSAELAAAESGLQAQIHAAAGVRLALELTVAALYASVLADAELLSLSEREATARADVVDGIAALVSKGLRSRLEHTRARAELLRAQVDVEIYRQRQAEDRRVLALQVGIGEAAFELAPLPSLAVCSSDQTITNAAVRAAADHPALREARASVALADANERAARAAKLPTLNLTAVASYGRSDLLAGFGAAVFGRFGDTRHDYALSAGLGIQWNALDLTIWDRAEAAAAQTRAEREGMQATALTLQIQTRETAKQAREAGLVLQRASELDELGELSLNAELERYRMGEGSLLQLLDAQRLRHEAQVARIDAQLARDLACVKLLLQSSDSATTSR